MGDNYIAGVIPCANNEAISFYSNQDSFEFYLLPNYINYLNEKKNIITLNPDNSFIKGITFNNHSILIYNSRKEIRLYQEYHFETDSYILSSSNIDNEILPNFNRISFQGGTLNSIFKLSGLDIQFGEVKDIANINDDRIKIRVENCEVSFDLFIRSIVSQTLSVKGNSISNNVVELEIIFENDIPLIDFYKHHKRMLELLSILTFRKNVGFDYISISLEDRKSLELSKEANVYMKKELDFTDKSYFENLTFDDLGNSISNLLKLIYESNEKKSFISTEFIPINDNDYLWITSSKIRELCSSLECELKYTDQLNLPKNEVLSTLITETKQFVNDYKKTKQGLTNETYDLIFSSIDFWTETLTERIIILYEEFYPILIQMNGFTPLTKECVRKFVKYRNDVTHGNHRILDKEIVNVYHDLLGIMYCCILTRIGIDNQRILEFAKLKLLKWY